MIMSKFLNLFYAMYAYPKHLLVYDKHALIKILLFK